MEKGWYFRFLVVFSAVVVAVLALWPSFDQWVPAPSVAKKWFEGRISPGLDIRGGLRLMYEVEIDEAIRDRRDRMAENLQERLGAELGIIEADEVPTREEMAKVRERVSIESVDDDRIRVRFTSAEDAGELDRDLLQEHFPELREVSDDDTSALVAIRDDQVEELRDKAVEQTKRTITNRIDELQIRETNVMARGNDIIVEVPGADDAMFDRIRDIISRTARLEFKVVADEDSTDLLNELGELPDDITRETEVVSAGPDNPQVVSTYLRAEGEGARGDLMEFVDTVDVPDGYQLAIGRAGEGAAPDQDEGAWRTYYLFDQTDVTGEDVSDAFVSFDPNEGNRPVVAVHFNTRGAQAFERMTGRNIKRRMAIVLDDRAESAPVIQQKIGGGRAQITLGQFADYNALLADANDLVVVLRAGALPAPIRPANEQLIGPTLGRDSIERGAKGALMGVGIVLIFMLLYYQVAGIVADVMVSLNVLFLLAILAGFEATLTLPGIAAIALTVGMAVDANVLITERIREELRLGKSPRAAVDQGFRRAFWSVFDSQVTTFIAGIVLFQFGTGPIKGFAVTLMIGIATSLFTGIFCSKVMLDWIVRGLRVQRLRVG
ncbi:MAG: protein translocase subunit SecD [Myxococcota bacterium]